MKYNRSFSELKEKAVLWWPEEIVKKNTSANILPKLLETQDKFLSILILAEDSPEQIFPLIKASNFPSNLFLKHLVILADYGGEMMKRLGLNFSSIFEKDKKGYYLEYYWHSKQYKYYFRSFGHHNKTVIDNVKLKIDQSHILNKEEMTDDMSDMIMILLYGSTSTVSHLAGLSSCEIGHLLGNKKELENFVKQRYIYVSKIVSGCKANDQGQIVQTEVCEYLEKNLGDKYDVIRNGKIKLKSYDKPEGMPFDVVISKNGKYVGIEISFQVTTNSTIERKSGQADNRQQQMHKENNYIAYVIDGAGNFQRESAVSTICEYSDCTIAFSEKEFNVLLKWVKKVLC